jgi:predicted secreted protein
MKKILILGAMAIALAAPNIQADDSRLAAQIAEENYRELQDIAYAGVGDYEGYRFRTQEEQNKAFSAAIKRHEPGYAMHLSAGADENRIYKKRTIHLAAILGNVEALNHMTTGLSRNEMQELFQHQDDDRQTVLALAHQHGNTNFVREMFDKVGPEQTNTLIEHTTSQEHVPDGFRNWVNDIKPRL